MLGPYHSRGVKGDDGCLQNLRGTRECERIQKRGAGQWCFKHDESSLIVGVHKHAMLGGGRLSYLVMEGVSKFTTHLAGCLLIISAARGDSASSVSAADDHANSESCLRRSMMPLGLTNSMRCLCEHELEGEKERGGVTAHILGSFRCSYILRSM